MKNKKACVRADRAARCCVCRQLYSVQPRVRGLGWRAWARLRYLMAAAAVTLLAFGLSGPPWSHVAVLLLLMLGVRSHSLLAVLALALACVLAVLHARGLRCATLPSDGPVYSGTVDAIADAVLMLLLLTVCSAGLAPKAWVASVWLGMRALCHHKAYRTTKNQSPLIVQLPTCFAFLQLAPITIIAEVSCIFGNGVTSQRAGATG